MFSSRSCTRPPCDSTMPVTGPPPPVLIFHVPDIVDSPRMRVNVISPVPRLSVYRPTHALEPSALACGLGIAACGASAGAVGAGWAGGATAGRSAALGLARATVRHVTLVGSLI